MERRDRKLDQAAHAAWLYYIASNTQEEIAAKLNVSRQAAQRLVALAVSEKLIKFRLDHPLSECIALAEALRDKFELKLCEVVPSDAGNGEAVSGIGVCAATHLEYYLASKTPNILAFSSGRSLRAMVDQISPMHQPQHKIVSIIGNMSQYGRAGRHEVVMRLADRIGSQVYLVPTPVVATSAEERDLLQTQRSFVTVKTLAEQAKITFVGVGQVIWNGPLHQNGFINDEEVTQLMELGAVGEIGGWAYDQYGTVLSKSTNLRVASFPLEQPTQRLMVAVAGTEQKVDAILGALRGRIINGLITDESVAKAILK
ncbi:MULTISPECIES: sugar-binding transcriptional regulator [unclassified Leptolyngbya]|uniref:sugar-binding transcriptional regulator n=1 Tax=unclassified Leptolyngbya TaxID=2650499 RepID=UPI0016877320|nr:MULTISPECIES: sugar-binding transcriptional regulator [unclassified Leptolyngbya]MBD1909466.1 sugar-binding transcriptional regulator [Leptolyngbya sp. FACHB-8]MBD2155637.1 sugar-binding transcriptional regulator [Leptolyngbya sp. FACHB-16]